MMKKKKYVSPLMEELGLESEVHLLVISDRQVEQKVKFEEDLKEEDF